MLMRPIERFAAMFMLAGGIAIQSVSAEPGDVTPQKAPDGARVFIISPKDGDSVSRDVHVVFGVEGVSVSAAGKSGIGTGHHHLLIDQSELPRLETPIPNDETHRHYGAGQTEDTIKLEPGKHTLQLDFADGRHVQFDPPIVSETITINVK
jgi:hypothetical protein